jgi:hypothetical protein
MASLMVTDLPWPEPPITTRLRPGATSRSMPSSTTLSPNRLWTPVQASFGVLMR